MNARILQSPSAERNVVPVSQVLAPLLPKAGLALEVASGTGQHVIEFARLQPGLTWQPSDPDPASCASIQARIEADQSANIRSAIALDVHKRPWPFTDLDLVVCMNMIHIAPWSAAENLIHGAAGALKQGGILFLYGPYLQEGVPTAPGNLAFDESLRSRNPQWGIRSLEAVTQLAISVGFDAPRKIEMPANNLALMFGRGAETVG